jgi:glyoxylase-like metal-dependent hydrolase (beta-lactamase superfamily II)
MTGLNHVQPGGAPLLVRLSPTVTMTKLSVGGPMDNNAYLLQAGSGATVLVDAANDGHRLLHLVGEQPVQVIVTTHRHPDHWQALAAVAERTGARLFAGRPDADAIQRDAGVSGIEPVWDGDTIDLGEETLTVIGLVGHTPGSIALAYTGGGTAHLFTGDSLFPGGAGRTTSPENFASLMDDLESKVFARFDDDTVVHPGHGDDTTLGAERPHLGEWRARGW